MGEHADDLIDQGMLEELEGDFDYYTDIWVGSDGRYYLIPEMTDQHLMNIIRWAERNGLMKGQWNPRLCSICDEARSRGLTVDEA